MDLVANWRARALHRPYTATRGIVARNSHIGFLPAPVLTSARRWETFGVVRVAPMNHIFIVAYPLDVPVERLRDWYLGILVRAVAGREQQRNKVR